MDPKRNHNKFYELSVEMLLFGPTVTRRWGRMGCRRPRILSKGDETWEEAGGEIREILRRRERGAKGNRRLEVGGQRFEVTARAYCSGLQKSTF